MKRFAVVAAIAALAVAAGTARGGAPATSPLLGIVGGKVLTQQLVRFDPSTLAPLPGGLPLAAHRYGWSFSPDGSRLALGRNAETCAAATTLRIVDVERLRSLGDLEIATSGAVRATAWLSPTRIVAVVGPGKCGTTGQTRVIAVDAGTGRVVATTWLRGTLVATARAPGELVLLLAPLGKIGSARLAVVDASGTVREKTLEAVGAGQRPANGSVDGQVATPGLAVDPAGRAFVVSGPDDGVTEVDLKRLRVGFYPLAERTVAKGSTGGAERAAVWLGNGLLAVTGSDSVNREVGGHREIATTPAGLRIVDTRSWKYRALDPQVSAVQLAGGILFATGSSYAYDGSHSTSTYAGLIAYSPAGRELYRVFDGLPVGRVAAIGGRGYATVGGATYRNRTVAFDLATGQIGRSLDQPLWELLLGRAAS